MAHQLAQGVGYVEPYGHIATAQWPPGYPAALAVVYKLFGFHVVLAKGLNIAFAAVTVIATYVIARRVFDVRVAYLGALILAFFPGQIYFSSLVQTETMFAMVFMLVLLLTLLWTVEREARWWQVLTIGALIGVAGLVRSEGVFLAFVLVALWALTVRPWRTTARYAALLAVGVALALTPWTVRNAVQLHQFVPLRADATLAISSSLDPKVERALILLGPNAGPRFSLAEGLKYQLTHPWQIPTYGGRRIAHLYENDSDGIRFTLDPGFFIAERLPVNNADEARLVVRRRGPFDAPFEPLLTEQEQTIWRGLADRYFFAAGTAALAAAALWFIRRHRASLLLFAAALGWTLLFGFIPPDTRFHHPLGPIIAVYAGAFVVFAFDAVLAAPARLAEWSKGLRSGAGRVGGSVPVPPCLRTPPSLW